MIPSALNIIPLACAASIALGQPPASPPASTPTPSEKPPVPVPAPSPDPAKQPAPKNTRRDAFLAARKALKTRLVNRSFKDDKIDDPPKDKFTLVSYPSGVGELKAYLSAHAPDGKKHPAIVWIIGGDANSIGDMWSDPVNESNDQTAGEFVRQGIVTMFPQLRGGNGGPGKREGYLGEIDDVIAAAKWLAKQEGVDPNRIYLGGHSTGGTIALLTAELSDDFRTVFALGPVDNPAGYGEKYNPYDIDNPAEVKVRSPIEWLQAVGKPTFVIEADGGNAESLSLMSNRPHPRQVQFLLVRGEDHFTYLHHGTSVIARKILADTGESPKIMLTAAELKPPRKRK